MISYSARCWVANSEPSKRKRPVREKFHLSQPSGARPFFELLAILRLDRNRLAHVLGCSKEKVPMPLVDISSLRVIERLPGWKGRYFHSPSLTFAHYDFERGASVHEHFHPQEEVYEVIEGELELSIDGVAQIARPGLVAIVPAGVRHSIKALTDGRAIIVDYPLRRDFD